MERAHVSTSYVIVGSMHKITRCTLHSLVSFKYWPTLLVESNGQGRVRNCPCFWITKKLSELCKWPKGFSNRMILGWAWWFTEPQWSPPQDASMHNLCWAVSHTRTTLSTLPPAKMAQPTLTLSCHIGATMINNTEYVHYIHCLREIPWGSSRTI